MRFHCPEHGDYYKRDVQTAYTDGGVFCPYPVHHGTASPSEIKAVNPMTAVSRYYFVGDAE